jgi:hypothetical protein
MLQFSRAIYRALAPRVLEDAGDPLGTARRQCVHEACEAAILRLARDHRYFAHPTNSLFADVRYHFALSDQLQVYQVIDKHIELALAYIATLPTTVDAFGDPRACQASTRSGTPCKREPLPGREYCPSHKHLEYVPELDSDRGLIGRSTEPLPV